MMNDPANHAVLVNASAVTATRARIEQKLEVETTAKPWGYGKWMINFIADPNVDLDFLRPDVLPPK